MGFHGTRGLSLASLKQRWYIVLGRSCCDRSLLCPSADYVSNLWNLSRRYWWGTEKKEMQDFPLFLMDMTDQCYGKGILTTKASRLNLLETARSLTAKIPCPCDSDRSRPDRLNKHLVLMRNNPAFQGAQLPICPSMANRKSVLPGDVWFTLQCDMALILFISSADVINVLQFVKTCFFPGRWNTARNLTCGRRRNEHWNHIQDQPSPQYQLTTHEVSHRLSAMRLACSCRVGSSSSRHRCRSWLVADTILYMVLSLTTV